MKKISRSENMSRIKGKSTSIELILRKELWKRGLRYRLNDKSIFGTPDIVFKRKKIAIFCDSKFWHGNKLLSGEVPKTNTDFWIKKLTRNIERDQEVSKRLKEQGWTVLRYWEKDIRSNANEIADEIKKIYKEKNALY
ncbi:MAG: very short patch repair endonuclease [Campylobacterales bacterium]|nr:very short patch repair endonuclease [Campylobacterales bacterium]